MISRHRRTVAIALGTLAFLALSVGLARWLETENAERGALLDLLSAQTRGDRASVLARLGRCAAAPGCRSDALSAIAATARPGSVKLLSVESHTAYALTSSTGRTRVAWSVPGRLPVVQCVLVRRSGDAISGLSVSLLALSPPISNTGDC